MDTSFQEQTVKVAVEFDLPVSELDQLTSQAHQPTSHFTSQRTQPGTGRSEVLESYGGQRGEDVPSRGGNLEGEGQDFAAGSSYQDRSFAGGALAPEATAFARDHSHDGARHHHHDIATSAHGASAAGESQYSTRSSHPGSDIQSTQGRNEDSHRTSAGLAGGALAGGALAGAGSGFGSEDRRPQEQQYSTSSQTTQSGLPHADRAQQYTSSSQTGSQGDSYASSGVAGGALAAGAAGFGASREYGQQDQDQKASSSGQGLQDKIKSGVPLANKTMNEKAEEATDEDGFTNLTGDKEPGTGLTGRAKIDPNQPEETVVETTHERSERDEQGRELDSYGKPYNI